MYKILLLTKNVKEKYKKIKTIDLFQPEYKELAKELENDFIAEIEYEQIDSCGNSIYSLTAMNCSKIKNFIDFFINKSYIKSDRYVAIVLIENDDLTIFQMVIYRKDNSLSENHFINELTHRILYDLFITFDNPESIRDKFFDSYYEASGNYTDYNKLIVDTIEMLKFINGYNLGIMKSILGEQGLKELAKEILSELLEQHIVFQFDKE